MEKSLLTDVFLPVTLGIIMLGMGLSLVPDNFRNILRYPKAVALGLFNQLLILPLVGFGIASIFDLRPEMAAGIMLLAACPGGATSNMISHISKGDTALSITLTAVSSLLTIITIPFVVNFGLETFMNEGREISLPIPETILAIFLISILPVVIGMLIRNWKPNFADKMATPVKVLSVVFLAAIIVGAILKERDILGSAFQEVGLSTLFLNLSTMLLGFLSARIFRLNLAQSITISIESGIQNGTMAITIAITLLHNSPMSIPPAVYSLIMFGTGGLMMFIFGRRKESATSAKEA